MRTVTDHIVDGDAAKQLTISVLDEAGQGGACHKYRVKWGGDIGGDGDRAEPSCLISFQNGPIKEFGVNGLTQEALLAVVIDRLRSFQAGPFPSIDNDEALSYCRLALNNLQNRTRERIARGVEGTTAE